MPQKPCKSAPLGAYINYYLEQKNWSQNKLARCARLEQPRLHKIISGKTKNIDIDVLVAICLALQLPLPKAADLLARGERALSPASKTHDIYRTLIQSYARKEPYDGADEQLLDEADAILKSHGCYLLPNCHLWIFNRSYHLVGAVFVKNRYLYHKFQCLSNAFGA